MRWISQSIQNNATIRQGLFWRLFLTQVVNSPPTDQQWTIGWQFVLENVSNTTHGCKMDQRIIKGLISIPKGRLGWRFFHIHNVNLQMAHSNCRCRWCQTASLDPKIKGAQWHPRLGSMEVILFFRWLCDSQKSWGKIVSHKFSLQRFNVNQSQLSY